MNFQGKERNNSHNVMFEPGLDVGAMGWNDINPCHRGRDTDSWAEVGTEMGRKDDANKKDREQFSQ